MEISEKDYELLKAKSENLATFKKHLTDRGFENVENLIEERDQLAVNLDKVQGHLEKSGKVIERQGAELGRFRNEKKVNPDDGQPPDNPPKSDKPKTLDENIKDVEARMSPEHWQLVEDFYQGLSDEDAREISENEEERRELYKNVMKKKYVRPKTLRDTVQQGNNKPAEPKKFENMFGKFLERGNHVPVGPGSTAPASPSSPLSRQMTEDARTH